jgi:DNA-binding response OmpR family regulator
VVFPWHNRADFLASKRNKKVLHVVTGNAQLVQSLRKHLNPVDYEIYRLSDLEKVAEVINASRSDIVIFDSAIASPNVITDYLDIRRKIDTPVIILCSGDCPDNMVRFFNLFGDGLFTEPFAIAEIGKWLDKVTRINYRVNLLLIAA